MPIGRGTKGLSVGGQHRYQWRPVRNAQNAKVKVKKDKLKV